MKTLTYLLTIFLSLFLLISCTNSPKSAKTAGSTVTVSPPQPVALQPTKQTHAPATVLPEPLVESGYLSSALKMNTGRATHTATLLLDGKALIAGGFREEGTAEIPIASAEIYDPNTNTFTPTGEMNEARAGHTATLLPNGLVLIVGGWGGDGRLPTTELYDPQTGKFRPAASMFAPRASMTATLLQNGQLLIAGGDSAKNTPQLIAERYDPATDTFTQSGSLHNGRSAHTATRLNDGRVLLIGGKSKNNNMILASAEIFDPTTGEFTLTGSMNTARHKHAAVLLPDGNVLVMGGSDENDWRGQYSSAELYDSGTGSFTPIADMNNARFKLADAAVLLNNGDVLVGGGNRQIELFDAQNQQFIAADQIDDDYYFSVLTLLLDGRVLITGGYDASIQPSEKAWVYTAVSPYTSAITGVADCPVTQPPNPPFIPPSPWPSQPPDTSRYWFGDNGLWVALPTDGIWSQLLLGEKFLWWSQEFDVYEDETPDLTMTGRRLGGEAPPFQTSEATNIYHESIDWAMMSGVELASSGCWELTGQYKGHQLSFVLWVPPG